MTPDDAEFIRRLALQRSGLVLTPDKDYLLRSRLEPVAQAEKLTDIAELTSRVRLDPFGRLAQRVVDALATHESYFFRTARPSSICDSRSCQA